MAMYWGNVGVTASQYHIQSVPTLMFFRNEEVLWRTSGVVDKTECWYRLIHIWHKRWTESRKSSESWSRWYVCTARRRGATRSCVLGARNCYSTLLQDWNDASLVKTSQLARSAPSTAIAPRWKNECAKWCVGLVRGWFCITRLLPSNIS